MANEGSIRDSAGLDASAPAETGPEMVFNSSDPDTGTPPDGILPEDIPESQDTDSDSSEPLEDKSLPKRLADTQRAFSEEQKKAARLEGQLEAMQAQLNSIQSQSQAPQEEAKEGLFDWVDDETLVNEFEEDPARAHQKSIKLLTRDIAAALEQQNRYVDSRVRSVDPMEEKIQSAYFHLGKQEYFHNLTDEQQQGAALNWIHSQNESKSSADSQPSPSATAQGGRRRVANEAKDVPLKDDPAYRPLFKLMGGIQDGQERYSINEASNQ